MRLRFHSVPAASDNQPLFVVNLVNEFFVGKFLTAQIEGLPLACNDCLLQQDFRQTSWGFLCIEDTLVTEGHIAAKGGIALW